MFITINCIPAIAVGKITPALTATVLITLMSEFMTVAVPCVVPAADIPTVVKDFGKRGLIHFVHFRNVRGGKLKFEETFHDEGQIDMYAAMKAYYDIGFKGPIRPDHVPTMAGDTNEHAGYSNIGSLYAFGYMRGLMQAISNGKK